MSSRSTQRIHPTAIISKETEIGAGVIIGPHVVIEGAVRIGPGCILRPFAHLHGPLSMGSHNQIFTGAVLGEDPQHSRYKGEPTSLKIGDNNIFREMVTIHRGTVHSRTTRIGSGNFFMANSHIAHDCQIGDDCVLANSALVGGHCILENNAYLSGNSAVHQFRRIGRLAHLDTCSVMTIDLPPFVLAQGFNTFCGVNILGMRRAGHTHFEIEATQRAFHILYRENNILSVALEKMDRELVGVAAVEELTEFIRSSADRCTKNTSTSPRLNKEKSRQIDGSANKKRPYVGASREVVR